MKGKAGLRNDHLEHGGNRGLIAARSGIGETAILDYSSNINPFGPPPWLAEAIAEGASRISFYPDPEATRAKLGAAQRYSCEPDSFLFADGADSLLFALPLALAADLCLLASPTYSGYRRAARRSGIPAIDLPLSPDEGFRMDGEGFLASLERELRLSAEESRAIVFLGAPNNPVGGILAKPVVESLAEDFPGHFFVVDESFLELSGLGESLIGSPFPNIIVVRSLTKAWAVPGARAGFMHAAPYLCARTRDELPAWPLSCFGEAIAERALADEDFLRSTLPLLLAEVESFSAALEALEGLRVFRCGANFLLVDFGEDWIGDWAAEELLKRGIAIRRFSPAEGLSGRYARLAVRSRADNLRFLEVLAETLKSARQP
jgi:histidinol-phosphate/aromatic aminotransferase/cobyric acid decarboxylase-like protein